MSHCEFSLQHYRTILVDAKTEYRLTNFAGNPVASSSDQATIILRHDVDRSLGSALNMARLESEISVFSTYFVLLHSNLYSVCDDIGVEILREIADLGHEIGLHYDPTFYAMMGWSLRRGVEHDLRILSDLVGLQVISVSRHLPLLGHQDASFPPEVKHDAYEPMFINGRFKYLSDSNAVFREGCFCGHLQHVRDYCFLVHPIWWNNPGMDWMEKLRNQICVDCKKMEQQAEQQISLFGDLLAERSERDAAFAATHSMEHS